METSYFQNIASAYAEAKYTKQEPKAMFIDLLKKSKQAGQEITSVEQFQELVSGYKQLARDKSLDIKDVLLLEQLDQDIQKHYPELGKQWLEKKQQAEQTDLSTKHTQEKKAFATVFNTNNKTIDIRSDLHGAYIDDLVKQNPSLQEGSKEQLETIKVLVSKNPNQAIHKERLTIKNNLVCIDGFTIPTRPEDRVKQTYANMKNNPKLRYPEYAKTLLNFTAQLMGTTFSFPSNWDKLQDNDINGELFLKEINTNDNTTIIKNLRNIVGFDSVIPVGQDSDGYIIYAGVWSVDDGFCRNHYDYHGCLVSSA